MVKTAAVAGAFGAAKELFAKPARAAATGKVIGANDRITWVSSALAAAAPIWPASMPPSASAPTPARSWPWPTSTKSAKAPAAEKHKCDGYLDYREIINRADIDAVVVATPDHWHAPIALEALDHGKDVYLEKPMCHTVEEARHLSQTVKETKRVLQVGSQTTSALQWHVAKKYIADGAIGKMIMSQGSYHRNSKEGEWNWPIDQGAGPDGKDENYIDWKMWLGKAPKRAFDADRFFRFRKYWDYSGGIATDLFFHVVAPLNICWSEPQFPSKVSASGGIYVFKDEREVPDTFHLMAEFPQGHSLVLSSTMANSQAHSGPDPRPRGHHHHGGPRHVRRPHRPHHAAARAPGDRRRLQGQVRRRAETTIPVEQKSDMVAHITNFLDCMRTREKPTLDVDTGFHAQVTISMAVQSYREGRVLYWDDKNQKVVNKPVKA